MGAVLDALARERTVIVPSLPGFPGGDRGHAVLDNHLDWLLAVRQLLQGVRTVWWPISPGSSVGASLAAEMAAVWPQSVRRLSLIAPFGLFDEKDPVTDPWAQRAPDVPGLLCHDPAIYEALKAEPEGLNSPEWPIEQTRAARPPPHLLAARNTKLEKAIAVDHRPDIAALGRT